MIILTVVLPCGSIRVILSVGDRSSSIFSVSSNALSSKILKVMAFSVSCGKKSTVWRPCATAKRELNYFTIKIDIKVWQIWFLLSHHMTFSNSMRE